MENLQGRLREEVLKLAEECGAQVYESRTIHFTTELLERFYQAASLAAAEKVKEEAAMAVVRLIDDDKRGLLNHNLLADTATIIRAIDVNKLFGE